MNSQEILNNMTLEEKASLCSGKSFWHTKAIERVGVPSIMVADGPNGLRKQDGDDDHVGLNDSVPATCFPTASATASSWDVDLMREMGQALAEECLQENIAVILGPGANIKRSPLCGRNFEYISEDPYVTGNMAAALINGVQSKGIGASLKHYAMNNQEARRMSIDAVVDVRAQREIYLTGFEIAVKKSQPWTVMCSYNRVDGTYVSDHKGLLTDILKEEWGHTGLVITDWGACNDRVQGIKAGLELEMPSSGGKNDLKIVAAVNDGSLQIKLLDKAVIRLIDLALKGKENEQVDYKYDIEAHRSFARKAASQSAVLLKNDGALPVDKNKKIAIVGQFAKKPRYQGAGSSLINPHKVDNVCKALDDMGISYEYAGGYDLKTKEPHDEMLNEAATIAKQADVVLVFAGLTADFESEGFDRTHLRMPESHTALIDKVSSVNSNVVVVLQNGAPIEMPWIESVNGLLECYLGGETGSAAVADVLFGKVNPSGKLAETFPVKLSDNSSYNYFPGSELTVEHRESIYVGYRYFEKAKKEVLFPFGFGLSYTTYYYSDLKVVKKSEFDYEVSLSVKNTGDVAGSEIIQVYVKNNESKIFKAEKELRAFDKVLLKAGEERQVKFKLDRRSFAYYNVEISDWHVDSGTYGVLVGASSADIRLSVNVVIASDDGVSVSDLSDALPGYYNLSGDEFTMDDDQFATLLGRDIPPTERDKNAAYDTTTTLGQIQHTMVGLILMYIIKKSLKKMEPETASEATQSMTMMFKAMVKQMPLRAFVMLGGEKIPKYFPEAIVDMLNGKFFRGLGKLGKK